MLFSTQSVGMAHGVPTAAGSQAPGMGSAPLSRLEWQSEVKNRLPQNTQPSCP